LETKPPNQEEIDENTDFTPVPYDPTKESDATPSASAAIASSSKKRKAPVSKSSRPSKRKRKVRDFETSEEEDYETAKTEEEGDDEDEEDELTETPPSTPTLRRGRKLGEDLEWELEQLSVKDRRFKMADLAGMGKDDFEREKIKARNRGLQRKAGLDKATKELFAGKETKKGKGNEKEKEKKGKGKGKEKEKEGEGKVVLRRSTRRAARAIKSAEYVNDEPEDTAMDVDPASTDVVPTDPVPTPTDLVPTAQSNE
ncbi:hypothetical protein K435DRAFT_876925, partial [Dendrothele bispora CBS 962.96]